MAHWVYDPHSGGVKIPERVKLETTTRIAAHAEKTCAGRYTRLDIRYKKQFCYIDAYTEPSVPEGPWILPHLTRDEYIERQRNTPTHLCRLRYFAQDRWSLAFYTYSHDKYEDSVFHSGEFMGTPEEGLDVGSVHLPESRAPSTTFPRQNTLQVVASALDNTPQQPSIQASSPVAPTARQSEYLHFIRAFTSKCGVPPSFDEIAQRFLTTTPSVNSMIKTLDAKGFLTRIPGQARTLRVLYSGGSRTPEKSSVAKKHPENSEIASLTRLAGMIVERLVPAVGADDLHKLSGALDAVVKALDIAATMAGASEKERSDARESVIQVALSAQGQPPDVGKARKTSAPKRSR